MLFTCFSFGRIIRTSDKLDNSPQKDYRRYRNQKNDKGVDYIPGNIVNHYLSGQLVPENVSLLWVYIDKIRDIS